MPKEFRLILKNADKPGYTPDIDCYMANGGYEALKKSIALKAKETDDGKTKPLRNKSETRSCPVGSEGVVGQDFLAVSNGHLWTVGAVSPFT